MLIKQQKSNGFSLIELLVVISIIAVLSALLMANFMGARERARDAQKISDLESIKSALRLYYNDHQTYPVGPNLNTEIGTVEYMPGISNIGFTYLYDQKNNGDGFLLRVDLEAGAGDDDVNSQLKCGIDVGDTLNGMFAVCAN